MNTAAVPPDNFQQALESYKQALALHPAFAAVYFNRGNVLKELLESERQTLRSNPAVLDFADDMNFDNTAALCECLDLVISIDTSVAHLSGALGQRTWILLAFNPDWRWLLGRTDSPWYRSATLYRQESIGNWNGVLSRVAADLQRTFASA